MAQRIEELPIDLPEDFDADNAEEKRAGCNAAAYFFGAACMFGGCMLAVWVLA
jgi:hypothetical protein